MYGLAKDVVNKAYAYGFCESKLCDTNNLWELPIYVGWLGCQIIDSISHFQKPGDKKYINPKVGKLLNISYPRLAKLSLILWIVCFIITFIFPPTNGESDVSTSMLFLSMGLFFVWALIYLFYFPVVLRPLWKKMEYFLDNYNPSENKQHE